MQITTADIGNERQLINAMKGVDVVIHCAALIDVGQYPNESEMQTVNVDGMWIESIIIKIRFWSHLNWLIS